MKHWQNALVAPETSLLEAMRVVDRAALQIALVAGPDRALLGTVTDGDVRRGILRGLGLDTPVAEVMNRAPVVAHSHESREVMLARMRQKHLSMLPIIDGQGHIVGLERLTEILGVEERDNWVVLMAGGEGRRLRPLTEDTPKPMLKVGSKPILETIIDKFIAAGFRKFFISVNYKAELVKSHFGDGADRDIRIVYLEETEKMGTAGALKLLPERPTAPFFVMNGDVLTTVDFQRIVEFHREQQSAATMCVREHTLNVPYGVAQIDGHRLTAIEEKPSFQHFVNAGLYLLDPEALDFVGEGEAFMTDVFTAMIAAGRNCAVFPIREYWIDVGHPEDLVRANSEYGHVFG